MTSHCYDAAGDITRWENDCTTGPDENWRVHFAGDRCWKSAGVCVGQKELRNTQSDAVGWLVK